MVLDECCAVEGLAVEYASLRARVGSRYRYHTTANQRQRALALDQVEHQRQYNEYAARFEATRSRISEACEQREAIIAKRGWMQSYLDTLKRQGLIAEFDEALWYGTVDQVRVTQNGKLRFIFKDGTVFEE